MKIYKLTIHAYDHFLFCDRSGFREIKKFFFTKEKAEKWIEENPRYIYCGFNGAKEAEDKYEMPSFKITEIEVE